MQLRPICAGLGALIVLNASPISAQGPITLPGDKVYPESITSDKAGNIYVGNLGSGGVFRIKAGSTFAESWIAPASYGSASVLGVLADDRSNTLWVCSTNLAPFGVVVPGADSVTALKGFDLTTGMGKVSAPLPNSPAMCNDITVGTDGSVYVSNSAKAEILRLAPGGKSLEVWFSDPSLEIKDMTALDGLAFGPDGSLYVNRYDGNDFYRIPVAGGKAGRAVKMTTSRPIKNPDAFRPIDGNRYLLVEGGGSVDLVTIAGNIMTVETIKDGFDIPTGATLVGKTVWVSESHFGYLFDPKLKGQTPPPFVVIPVEMK